MTEDRPRPRISAVLNTLNEAARLPFSLGSVSRWVDEIVVVDMGSDDETVAVAEAHGARVYTHERLGFADPARAWSVAQSTGSWVLILDADEMVPPRLAGRLMQIAEADSADVVVIPRSNYLLGARLSHTGWGPDQDHHPRFFRRSAVDLKPDIHAYMSVRDSARILRLPPDAGFDVVHFNYVDVDDFITRLNRYTSIEARQHLSLQRRSSPSRALREMAVEFGRRYFRQGGYRDGWRGWYLSMLMATYRLAVSAKVVEMNRGAGRAAVLDNYRKVADAILHSYDTWDGPK
jgi:glycosyltransferase involved in cell wall biosynthesis